MSVLDLGTGTGNLAIPFEEIGCGLWCTDFAPSMLEKASEKLPDAQFIQFDLRNSWPDVLNRKFDRIISGYVFHHFDLGKKVSLFQNLACNHLEPGGNIVIADISFQNQLAMDEVRHDVGDEWEDEFYWLADEVIPALEIAGLSVEYHPISFCGAVFAIR